MENPIPQIMESSDNEYKKPKDRLVYLLDQIELRVEQLRRDALRLEEEKDTMLTTLETLRTNENVTLLEEGELILISISIIILNQFIVIIDFF